MNINELVSEAVNTSYYNPSASDRALPPNNRPKSGPKGSSGTNDRLTMGDKSVLVGGAALGLAGVNHAANRATSTLSRVSNKFSKMKQHVNGEFPNIDLRRKIASAWVKAQAAKQHMGH